MSTTGCRSPCCRLEAGSSCTSTVQFWGFCFEEGDLEVVLTSYCLMDTPGCKGGGRCSLPGGHPPSENPGGTAAKTKKRRTETGGSWHLLSFSLAVRPAEMSLGLCEASSDHPRQTCLHPLCPYIALFLP